MGVRTLLLGVALALMRGTSAMFVGNDTKMYSEDGTPLVFHGIHIFGLNTADGAAGLSAGTVGGPSEVGDWKTIVWRVRQLGFNAVRLPFNFYFSGRNAPNYKTPCTVTQSSALVAGVTPPGRSPASDAATDAPPTVPGGVCNADMPDDYMERLIWSVCHLTEKGLYVVLDHHLDYSLRSETEGPVNNPLKFAEQWGALVRALVENGCARDRLIIDFINEPDAHGMRWNSVGTFPGGISLTDMYRLLFDTVFEECPTCLYFVEGASQYNWPTLANWGDGFATHRSIIRYSREYYASEGLAGEEVESAAAFLNWLVQQPYFLPQVVLSPHVYGPNVTGSDGYSSGQKLWRRLTDTFGYLTSAGEGFVSDDGSVWRFAVAIGEMGSSLANEGETSWFESAAAYMFNTGAAATGPLIVEDWVTVAEPGRTTHFYSGLHGHVESWFWWVWNPDSADTGGLVADDRKSIDWAKVDLLAGDSAALPDSDGLRLCPWYHGSAACSNEVAPSPGGGDDVLVVDDVDDMVVVVAQEGASPSLVCSPTVLPSTPAAPTPLVAPSPAAEPSAPVDCAALGLADNVGVGNDGCGNVGNDNVGDFNVGSNNVGNRNIGSFNRGDCNQGSYNVGNGWTGSNLGPGNGPNWPTCKLD